MSLNLDKSTWQRVAFGDVIDSITDRVDNPSGSGVDRYVGLEHLDPGVMTVQRWDSPDKVEAQKLRFRPGDVIFGRRRAYQKKVARADFEGICSAHALVLRARPGLMDPDFLPVFLSSDYFLDRAISISVGSLSPTVNWRDLKVQEFLLPPVPEQKRLAGLMHTLEAHRLSMTDQLLALANKRTRTVDSWVTATGATRCPLGELAEIRGGIQKGKATKGDALELPYLSVSNVQAGRLNLSNVKKIQVSAEDAEKYKLQDGDVLMTEGGDIDKLGRGTVWRSEITDCLHQNHVFAVRPYPDRALPEWLNLYSESTHGRTYFRLSAKRTSNLASINKKQVSDFPVGKLDLETQRQALRDVAVIDRAIGAANHEMRRVVELRAALLVEIFGGQ